MRVWIIVIALLITVTAGCLEEGAVAIESTNRSETINSQNEEQEPTKSANTMPSAAPANETDSQPPDDYRQEFSPKFGAQDTGITSPPGHKAMNFSYFFRISRAKINAQPH